MKKSTITALSLLAAGLALAQAPLRAADAAEKPAHGENSRRDPVAGQLKMLTGKLGLTEAQQGQVTEILKGEASKVAALRADGAGDRKEKAKQMREIREESRGKIRAILTAEQQKIFDSLPKRRPGGPGGPGGSEGQHGGGDGA